MLFSPKMILLKNNKKISLEPYYTKSNNTLRFTVSIYENNIYSLSDGKTILYLHENKLLNITFEIGTPLKQYKLIFNEYAFDDKKIAYISDSTNFKQPDYIYVIFEDSDGYPYVYNYLKNKYQIIENQYIVYRNEILLKNLVKNKLI